MTLTVPKIQNRNESAESFRLQIIAPVIRINRETEEGRREFRDQIAQIASEFNLSERTLKRWIERYEKGGLPGLRNQYPKVRSDCRLFIKFESLMNEAKVMRMHTPTISVKEIIRCLESRHPNLTGIVKRSTLQRHLFEEGFGRRTLLQEREQNGRAFFGRYRKEHRMEQIQGDVKEPPRGVCVDENGMPVTPYVQLWMDNYSRKILSWRIGTNQQDTIALSSLRQLIETHGVPASILTDQGSIYNGKAMLHCTRTLGIVHKKSRPYKPQSKGALERVNETLDDLFIPFESMTDVRFDAFKEIVENRIREYNSAKHSALVEYDSSNNKTILSPDEAFEKDSAITARIPDPQVLDAAFTTTEYRRISKDGLISYNGKKYLVKTKFCKSGEFAVISTSLTDRTVRQVIENTKEEIERGADVYSFHELTPFVPKSNVRFKDIAGSVQTKIKKDMLKNLPQIPAQVERQARELLKSRGLYKNEEIFMNTQLPAILFTQQINQNLQTAPVYGGAVSLPEVSSDENLETAPTANEEPSCSPTGGTQAELPSGVDNKEFDFDEEIDFDSDKSLYSRNIGE